MIARVLLGVLIPFLLLNAQPAFFGYFESEIDGLGFAGETYLYQYNKLRLDFEAYPSDDIQIGANVNLQRYSGKTTWNLLDFLPMSVWEPVFHSHHLPDSLWTDEFPYPLPDTMYIDNMYARLQFPWADLTLGKQQLSFGTGYAWNPTDIFNVKSLLDPSYEQTGVTAIRLEVPTSARGSVNLVYQPSADWDGSTKLMAVKLGTGRFDMTGTYAEYPWHRSDLMEPAGTDVMRTLAGGSLVGELLGIGVWAEAATTTLAGDDGRYDEYIIGFDYTFETSTYVLFEYLHNGNGKANPADLTLNDYLQSFSGETHSLMQNYGFLYAMHPIGDFGTLGFMAFANLDDESAALNPSFDWAGFENVNFNLMLSGLLGDKNTEFGVQDWGLRLRMKAYF